MANELSVNQEIREFLARHCYVFIQDAYQSESSRGQIASEVDCKVHSIVCELYENEDDIDFSVISGYSNLELCGIDDHAINLSKGLREIFSDSSKVRCFVHSYIDKDGANVSDLESCLRRRRKQGAYVARYVLENEEERLVSAAREFNSAIAAVERNLNPLGIVDIGAVRKGFLEVYGEQSNLENSLRMLSSSNEIFLEMGFYSQSDCPMPLGAMALIGASNSYMSRLIDYFSNLVFNEKK